MSYCLRDRVVVDLQKSQLNTYKFGLQALIKNVEKDIEKEKHENVISTYKNMITTYKEEIAFINNLLNNEESKK